MFDASVDILKAWGMSFSPMEDLITGPLSDLHSRIEAIANVDPLSPAVPAARAAIGPPTCLSMRAKGMPILKANEVREKNTRQRLPIFRCQSGLAWVEVPRPTRQPDRFEASRRGGMTTTA